MILLKILLPTLMVVNIVLLGVLLILWASSVILEINEGRKNDTH